MNFKSHLYDASNEFYFYIRKNKSGSKYEIRKVKIFSMNFDIDNENKKYQITYHVFDECGFEYYNIPETKIYKNYKEALNYISNLK
mgnify:CR=1 FL=1